MGKPEDWVPSSNGPDVVTPLKADVFEFYLANKHRHPDQDMVGVVLAGIRQGFTLGAEGMAPGAQDYSGSKPPKEADRDKIESYFDDEVGAGRMAGPFRSPPHPNALIWPQFCVPKQHFTDRDESGVLMSS